MPIQIGDRVLYSSKEAAERIGRSKDTLYRWIKDGLVLDVERNDKEDRVWTEEDIARFKVIKNQLREKRKKRVGQ